jgi:hypothetical protein
MKDFTTCKADYMQLSTKVLGFRLNNQVYCVIGPELTDLLIPNQGCQIFPCTCNQNRKNVPKEHIMYQMVIKYSKCPQKITDGHKIYQHLPTLGTPKFTQIRIFGLKTNHLATLVLTHPSFAKNVNRLQIEGSNRLSDDAKQEL